MIFCLEFFTHRDKRPCRSSSKPHSYTQRFFKTANQFGTPTPLPVPQLLAKRTSQRLAGARKDPVRSQNAFLSTMTNSAPETTTKIRSGKGSSSSLRVRSGNRRASRRQRAIGFQSPEQLRHRNWKAGGADRDRTGDPLLAKQVLSQLSYSPGKRRRSMIRSVRSVWRLAHLNFGVPATRDRENGGPRKI